MENNTKSIKAELLKSFYTTIQRNIELDKEIFEKTQERTAALRQIDILEHQISKLEIGIKIEVQKERNSDNKPVFTNQELRDAETKNRLNENTAYTELKTKIDDLTFRKQELDTIIESFLRRVNIAKLESQMLIAVVSGGN